MALTLQQITESDLIRLDQTWLAYWFGNLKLHSYSGRTSKDYIRKLQDKISRNKCTVCYAKWMVWDSNIHDTELAHWKLAACNEPLGV